MRTSRRVLLAGWLLGAGPGCGAGEEAGPAPAPAEDLGPQVPVSPGPPQPAPGFQQFPAVASGGGVTLVVWMDDRTDGKDKDIYGARLGPGGAVLDRGGFPIAVAMGAQEFPDVIFDGTSFVVAWEDGRGGPGPDVYAARVSPEGRVLDPDGVPVSRAAGRQVAPSLAVAGPLVLLTWQDGRDSPADGSQNDIYGARLRDGKVLDPDGLPIAVAAGRQAAPAAAALAGAFFVAWQDLRGGEADLYGARVSAAGAVLDPAGLPLVKAGGVQSFPALISGGDRLLLAWGDARGATTDIFAAQIGAQGKLLSPGAFAVSRAAGEQQFVAGAWDGARFLLCWQDERGDVSDVYGARVEAGRVLDTAGLLLSRGPALKAFPHVAFDGADLIVAWQDFRNPDADIYGARVDAAGARRDTGDLLIPSVPAR